MVLVLLPVGAFAADPLMEQPHWSLEVKGGRFIPAIDNWQTYYGKRYTSEYAGSLAYKITRQLEFGLEGGTIRDKGKGLAPTHGTLAGEVVYQLFPVSAFVLVRGILSENQWLVPYVGGGWTRMYYQEKIQNQTTVRGFADGSHFRAGLQFSLDGVDPGAANSMYLDYGVHHTYFFIEAERTRAVVKSVSANLGGTSYQGGLLFEF